MQVEYCSAVSASECTAKVVWRPRFAGPAEGTYSAPQAHNLEFLGERETGREKERERVGKGGENGREGKRVDVTTGKQKQGKGKEKGREGMVGKMDGKEGRSPSYSFLKVGAYGYKNSQNKLN